SPTATSSVCSASTLTTTTPRGRPERSSSARLNPRRMRYRAGARSTAATGSVASSTSTTEPPHDQRHELNGALHEFERGSHAEAACRLRRYDDAGKDPSAVVPPLESYRPLLRSLLRA